MIVIVNDHQDSTRVLVRLIKAHGFDVAGFLSPVEALDAMRRHPPRLLITDNQMPEMNGLELVRIMRDEPRLARTPVVFTASVSELQEEARRLDVIAYLFKPVDWPQLLEVIERTLQRSSSFDSEVRQEQVAAGRWC